MTPTEEELLDKLFYLHVLESEKHRVFEESLMNTEDFEILFWPWNFDVSSPGQRNPELKRYEMISDILRSLIYFLIYRIFSFIPPVNCHVWKEQGRMSMKDDDQQILTLESELMNQQMTKLKRMTSEEDDDMGTQDTTTINNHLQQHHTTTIIYNNINTTTIIYNNINTQQQK